ncbi:hypothetical protein [Yoonia vestfoldensis]|uniref:hypothetical protein n=1 Tax=Yoonia vestfoldensis TaxID=245188 RepID=UPI000361587E|nr:hypothetical protein [Yoonia vestfoldensis]
MKGDLHDTKALIRESYLIDGITEAECRTIFLDWVLGLPVDQDVETAVRALLARHADTPTDHPMTRTLQHALQEAGHPRRRGGRKARLGVGE